MTRVNFGLKPKALTDEHLLTEIRELKRIPNALKKYYGNKHVSDIPILNSQFSLGSGHVKWFYNKGLYTYRRYFQLLSEANIRNLFPTNMSSAWDFYSGDKEQLFNDAYPSLSDSQILVKRILQKMQDSPMKDRFHYYKQLISIEDYSKIINNIENAE